jgi:hypothetical protein
MDEVKRLFPVRKEQSIGLEYGERCAIIKISKEMISFEKFPGKELVAEAPAESRLEIFDVIDPTLSTSGKWAFFSADGEGKVPDTHYIVYLDPRHPAGYRSPYKLCIEGKVNCVGWMTAPEGLVVYKDGKLWYFDVSEFEGG